ncbi:PadR family transcriptional regulator [Kordiimonas marina]|uniref:PadR family transcriptional regulator n=1 Tax=Kordiimonas marina TaxID=2872312 RepID=UPI001FF4B598|nr:PadR family transcriptional regulator [Kordiimonas marina]MCJ9429154.1 PadR family transcriptional regulator [Kordiimonas marina]
MKAEILILGVLHRGDMHPYEIKRRLKLAQVENYLDVDIGTLYYAVKQLAKDGLIEERGQEKSGRQVRTIYGVTDAGRARLQTLIMEAFASDKPPMHPLYPSLLFLDLADRDNLLAFARERLAAVETGLMATEAIYNILRTVMAAGGRLLMENAIAHQRTEIDWTRTLITEIEAGPLFPGDPAAFEREKIGEKLATLSKEWTKK